jgi:hypothetical protein
MGVIAPTGTEGLLRTLIFRVTVSFVTAALPKMNYC